MIMNDPPISQCKTYSATIAGLIAGRGEGFLHSRFDSQIQFPLGVVQFPLLVDQVCLGFLSFGELFLSLLQSPR